MSFWNKIIRDSATEKFSDVDIIKRLLRQTHSARDFVTKATRNRFTVVHEGPRGIEMIGPDSKLILTVLASHGADTIFTLSIKQGSKPAETLVDNCKLLY